MDIFYIFLGIDIPAIVLNGGPMLGGVEFGGRKSDATSVSEAFGMYKTDKISLETYRNVEDLSCPTRGSCSFMGTANTMCCLAEALGMTLPDAAAIPAVYADRLRLAEQSGEAVCHLVRQGISSRDIINNKSLENAVKVCLAIGGSTNAVMHLCALAYEAELDINIMDAFDTFSKNTPTIAKIYPAAHWDMEDLWKAGGIPRVMDRLQSLLHMDVMTCTGRTMKAAAAALLPSILGCESPCVARLKGCFRLPFSSASTLNRSNITRLETPESLPYRGR